MFDDAMRLRDDPRLAELFSHYADLGKTDRATWQDRLMSMDGIDAKDLSKLHGELIALDWIEQNTGQAIARQDGTLSACYRITLHGLSVYGRFYGIEIEDGRAEPPGKSQPKFPRKKKPNAESPESVVVAPPEESFIPAA